MTTRGRGPARRRFEALPPDASREEWFATLRDAIAEFYLADPTDPYRGSGRSSGAAGWETKRRCIADAVHRDGEFLDIGCANGLLLETLTRWCAERGHRIRPHGIDFVPGLIELARARHPGHEASFEVANAFTWEPRRRYDFVRTNLEYLREPDWRDHLHRLYDRAVAPGGRLIVCHYRNEPDPVVDVPGLLERLGFTVAGSSGAPNVALAWTDKPLG